MSEALSQSSLAYVIERWSGAENLEGAFAVYASVSAEYGFDQINYFDMTGYVGRDPDEQPVAYSEKNFWTFDKAWFDYYVDRAYGPHDPVFPWLRAARHPFKWDDASRSSDLTGQQSRVMREAKEAGLNDGFSIPLCGPNGQLSALCVAASARDALLYPGFQICSLLGQHFHNLGMELEGEANRGLPGTPLTQREREVLLWCARGKSNWAIGEILGISAHGVRFHVQNINKKLDANSRIAAVVKAIRMGLIHP